MEINLQGRTAVVGGSSRGLGRAIAFELAESGATVILCGRNEAALAAVQAKLPTPFGAQHDYLLLDYSDLEAFRERSTAFLQDREIDILVNNTNGPAAGGVLDKTIDDYQQAFDLLFKNVVHITQECLKGMRRRNYGRIINLASVSVKEPLSNLVLSNAIRSATAAWAKTLARDVAGNGITVNTILTGYFDTERLTEINAQAAVGRGVSLEAYKEKMKAEIPAGRFGEPAEFGYLVAFLASDLAAYITGAQIPIDGGLLRSL